MVAIDRKLNLLEEELKGYRKFISGIEERSLFGNDVWPGIVLSMATTIGSMRIILDDKETYYIA